MWVLHFFSFCFATFGAIWILFWSVLRRVPQDLDVSPIQRVFNKSQYHHIHSIAKEWRGGHWEKCIHSTSNLFGWEHERTIAKMDKYPCDDQPAQGICQFDFWSYSGQQGFAITCNLKDHWTTEARKSRASSRGGTASVSWSSLADEC